MTNSKPLVRKHCAPHTAAASTHGCPVVKAAFNSAIGIDVHHSILVCAYQACDTQAGEIRTEVAEFGTTVSALKELIEWVKQRQPQRILMESTGVLWLSPYEALERAGFTSSDLALINARDFKAVAGRKTDTQDAIRLAEYARLGNIRTSFVPAREFREQRQIARQITKHTNELQRCKSRLIKTLNFVGCRPTAAFSNVNGKAAQKILMEYIRGANIRKAAEKHGARLRHTRRKSKTFCVSNFLKTCRICCAFSLRRLIGSKRLSNHFGSCCDAHSNGTNRTVARKAHKDPGDPRSCCPTDFGRGH